MRCHIETAAAEPPRMSWSRETAGVKQPGAHGFIGGARQYSQKIANFAPC